MSDMSSGGTDRSKVWVVALECLAEDGSTYLYETHTPVCGTAETPMDAVHWALSRTARSDEDPCGIDEVRKVDRDAVIQDGDRDD